MLKEQVEEILEFEPLDVVDTPWRKRRVQSFKRKSSGKIYTGPRIILSSQLKDLVGKNYIVFRSRAIYRTLKDGQEESRKEGDAIILFLPNNSQVEKQTQNFFQKHPEPS
jgi:hypothetical protein